MSSLLDPPWPSSPTLAWSDIKVPSGVQLPYHALHLGEHPASTSTMERPVLLHALDSWAGLLHVHDRSSLHLHRRVRPCQAQVQEDPRHRRHLRRLLPRQHYLCLRCCGLPSGHHRQVLRWAQPDLGGLLGGGHGGPLLRRAHLHRRSG